MTLRDRLDDALVRSIQANTALEMRRQTVAEEFMLASMFRAGRKSNEYALHWLRAVGALSDADKLCDLTNDIADEITALRVEAA